MYVLSASRLLPVAATRSAATGKAGDGRPIRFRFVRNKEIRAALAFVLLLRKAGTCIGFRVSESRTSLLWSRPCAIPAGLPKSNGWTGMRAVLTGRLLPDAWLLRAMPADLACCMPPNCSPTDKRRRRAIPCVLIDVEVQSVAVADRRVSAKRVRCRGNTQPREEIIRRRLYHESSQRVVLADVVSAKQTHQRQRRLAFLDQFRVLRRGFLEGCLHLLLLFCLRCVISSADCSIRKDLLPPPGVVIVVVVLRFERIEDGCETARRIGRSSVLFEPGKQLLRSRLGSPRVNRLAATGGFPATGVPSRQPSKCGRSGPCPQHRRISH